MARPWKTNLWRLSIVKLAKKVVDSWKLNLKNLLNYKYSIKIIIKIVKKM